MMRRLQSMKEIRDSITEHRLSQFYEGLGLGQKIIIPFLSVFLSVLLLGSFILGSWFTRTLELNLYQEVDSFSVRVSQDLQSVQQSLDTQVRLLATQDVIQQAIARRDRSALLQHLLPLKAEFNLDLIKVVDANGGVWLDSRKGFSYQTRLEDEVAISSASSGLHLTDVMTVADGSRVLLVAVAPVKSTEKVLGGIIIGVFVNDDMMNKIAAGSSKSVVAFSNQKAIATSDLKLLEKPWQPLSVKESAKPVRINKQSYIAKSLIFAGRSQSLLLEVLYPVNALNQAKDALWINILILSGLGSATVIIIGSIISRAIAAKLNAQFHSLQQALKDLRNTQTQLIQAEKMSSLGQMVAGIAHEINNPANFIHANITYLRNYIQDLFVLVGMYGDRAPDDKIQAFLKDMDLDYIQQDSDKILKSMKAGTGRITQIVLSLRNFSRLDESEMKTVDIHEGIENTLLLLNYRLGQTIEIQKKYSNLPLVECYPAQLNQMFLNLLTNAIDAVEEEQTTGAGRIVIETEVGDSITEHCQQIMIRIQDNGCGMSPETKHRMFDPFFTTKPVGQGTGLGMAIVYQIIKQHDGEMAIESGVGQGTELTVTLPIQQSA
jgi:two-component system, NtrC family, sensor kinase